MSPSIFCWLLKKIIKTNKTCFAFCFVIRCRCLEIVITYLLVTKQHHFTQFPNKTKQCLMELRDVLIAVLRLPGPKIFRLNNKGWPICILFITRSGLTLKITTLGPCYLYIYKFFRKVEADSLVKDKLAFLTYFARFLNTKKTKFNRKRRHISDLLCYLFYLIFELVTEDNRDRQLKNVNKRGRIAQHWAIFKT